jgi:hypothetical protein
MTISIEAMDRGQATFGLIVAGAEDIRDTLNLQALRVIDGGVLDAGRRQRVGRALRDLDIALQDIKQEPGVAASVRAVKNDLGGLVDDMVSRVLNPGFS